MSNCAHSISTDASFQAFANCYLKEVDAGQWCDAKSWGSTWGTSLSRGETHVVELKLAHRTQELALGVRYRSLVGRHTLTDVYLRSRDSKTWRPLDLLSAELMLIDSLYAARPEDESRVELLSRVLESHRVMSTYVSHALLKDASKSPATPSGFIESEQSTVLGHWLHPTPKSRQGFLAYHHEHYAPEMSPRFSLHFFAVKKQLVRQVSLDESSAEEIVRQIAQAGPSLARYTEVTADLGDEFCLLPLHPLQAQWLLHQDYIAQLIESGQVRDVGRLGALFTPTSSVRTLYCETFDYMVKLSIPVKLTNSLRLNLASELGDSVWVSQLYRRLRLSELYPHLHILQDPAYISVELPGLEETGFEVIFRQNPFTTSPKNQEQGTVQSVAALVQEPLHAPGSLLLQESRTSEDRSPLARLIERLAQKRSLSARDAALLWFDSYFKHAIRTPIELYDRQGIALEAHQQNSLLGFDESGLVKCSYYRDIQGLSLLQSFRDQLVACVPELALQAKIFEPDEVVQEGFGYYLFFNQLYSVVNRLSLDGFVGEVTLVAIIRSKLSELLETVTGPGVAFIEGMLSVDSIGCKANLLTRAADVDELETENELGVYVRVPNPLKMIEARTEAAPEGRSSGLRARPDALTAPHLTPS